MEKRTTSKKGRRRSKRITINDVIEPSIRISARIETHKGKSETWHQLMVTIQCGADEKRENWIGPIFVGQRRGKEWDKTLLTWTRAYRYIAENIGSALKETAMLVRDEADIFTSALLYKHLDLRAFCATSQDLTRYDECMGSTFVAGQPYPAGEFFRYLMGQQAFWSRHRLPGWERLNVGSPERLRYTWTEMELLITEYPERVKLWTKIRKSQERDGDGWRNIVKRPFHKELNKHSADKLLDLCEEKNGNGKPKWKTSEIAMLDSSRRMGAHNREKFSKGIEITQAASVLRDLRAFKRERAEALRLGLNWHEVSRWRRNQQGHK